jgi:hypothetical protein
MQKVDFIPLKYFEHACQAGIKHLKDEGKFENCLTNKGSVKDIHCAQLKTLLSKSASI